LTVPAVTQSPDVLAARASALLGEPVDGIEVLPGGTSTLTYRAQAESRGPVVIKVSPAGLPATGNRDIMRQARVLAALSEAPAVATPPLLGADAGDPPDEPQMLIMGFVEGDDYEPVLDRREVPLPAAELRGRALAAAAMLATMHRLDPVALGLGDERAIDLDREVGRWEKAFSTVDPGLAPGAEECGRRLRARLPERDAVGLLHGDWRLGNMLSQGAEVRAVIDWEIWSLGDPLVDLAWFTLMSDPSRPTSLPPPPGMPSPEELRRRYAEAGGETSGDLDWFAALVRFKQAAAGALIVKNRRRRGEDEQETARMAALTEPLLAQALEILG
jgi:aminoglycoside phosphotransferase (APT) family kinase protein